MRTIPGNSIEAEMFDNAYKNHQLYQVIIELCNICNWKCKHCYIPKHNNYGLDTEVWIDLIRRMRSMGLLNISFTGGEIFLRKDIFKIIEYARSQYCSVSLLSNASCLDEEKIKKLSGLYINNYSCSIFSMDEKIHDYITGVPGSLKTAIKNILLLKQYGIHVTVKTPIMKMNQDSYLTVKSFCEKNNIVYSMSPTIFAKSDGNMETHKLRVDSDALYKAIRESDITNAEYKKVRTFLHDYPEPCATVYTNLAINCEGDVTPCNAMYYKLGNITDTNIEDIWSKSQKLEKLRAIKKDDLDCRNCHLKPYCERCPGLALLENGTLTGCCDACRLEAEMRYEVIKNQGNYLD